MVGHLLAIERARATIAILSLPPDASVRLTYEARRKSTRASVAIEGNVLTDQMGLPMNYYEGRHDPDHTPWLEWFCATLARAASDLQQRATSLHRTAQDEPAMPWERLSCLQQQALARLLNRRSSGAPNPYLIRPAEAEEWFGVSAVTAREWLSEWAQEGFLAPQYGTGGQRISGYRLAAEWIDFLDGVAQARSEE